VIISVILTCVPGWNIGRCVNLLSLHDIYREPGFGFGIMLKRPCFTGFPSWMAVFALAHAQDTF
jgi:hypothetical protein